MSDCRVPRNRDHPAKHARTRRVIGSMGLTSGMPTQAHYEEYKDHPTYASEDLANYYINDEACIPQSSNKIPIIGEVPFVYDTPFDPLLDARINQRMALVGLGAMVLGGLLYGA